MAKADSSKFGQSCPAVATAGFRAKQQSGAVDKIAQGTWSVAVVREARLAWQVRGAP